MANTRPIPIKFLAAVRLCILLLFAPKKLIEEQRQDAINLNCSTVPNEREHSAYIVRRAFLYSLLLVIASGAIGYVLGQIFGLKLYCATTKLISWLQIVGTCLLLWGTLFVRGWEIETYCGVTFTERINQWLYRALYCVGTAVLVCSLSWPQCTSSAAPLNFTLGVTMSIVAFPLIILATIATLVLWTVQMLRRHIIYKSFAKMRFSYILTLAVEKHLMSPFMWFFAIVFCSLADSFNSFDGWIYYTCNILAFLLGWFVGLYLNIILAKWMRKRTIWAGEWEDILNNDSK